MDELEETQAAEVDRLREEFFGIAGIHLPDPLCGVCEQQGVNWILRLQTLEELLSEGLHSTCLHSLTVVTVLHAAINGDGRLRARLHEDLSGPLGWNDFREKRRR